jgi:carbonic anhydrase/acetyltransferase-like protein (isoleucine patch superfamily)
MIANLGLTREVEVTIVLDESSRSTSLALATRWKKQTAKVHLLERGLGELARLLAASEAETVLFASLSSICVLEPGSLRAMAADAGDQLVKISVARTPIEMYCARKKHIERLLGAAAARTEGKIRLRESLFDGALHSGIDLIEDVPGELLFQNDLMEFYANNIWVLANCGSERYHRILSRLPELSDKGAESHVAEKGSITNSWLASSVEVEGAVENSIIFPNVVVKRNSLVSRSVVLNGNRIGANTEIHNALILPFAAEAARTTPNIGDNCAIGAKSSSMNNIDFPAQIRDGVTVIGTNAEIPNGFRAEAASYVAPGVPVSTLRRLKLLRRGTSALLDHAAPAQTRDFATRDAR